MQNPAIWCFLTGKCIVHDVHNACAFLNPLITGTAFPRIPPWNDPALGHTCEPLDPLVELFPKLPGTSPLKNSRLLPSKRSPVIRMHVFPQTSQGGAEAGGRGSVDRKDRRDYPHDGNQRCRAEAEGRASRVAAGADKDEGQSPCAQVQQALRGVSRTDHWKGRTGDNLNRTFLSFHGTKYLAIFPILMYSDCNAFAFVHLNF